LTITPTNHFFDSCVIARYLTEIPPNHVPDIAKMILESMSDTPKRLIWFSTILVAEVRPSQLRKKGFGSIEDLMNTLHGVLKPIGPTMPILMRAARLRDHQYLKERPQANEKPRILTVPDSIQLATCLHVKEALGITDIEFNTFDDGKSKNYEEKAVSLLRFHEYAAHLKDDADVAAVCSLNRMKPTHREPSMV
jgi:hypothetical protein